MTRSTIPCSVEILTHNSGATLALCLQSVADFDDIIVVDGGSTDGTRAIAERQTHVRIIDQDRHFLDHDGRIIDFASVRNQGLVAARHEWILLLDADEVAAPTLSDEVRAIVERGVPGVFNVFRRFVVDSIPIEHCSCYPALQIRLFHRSCVRGFVKSVHERLDLLSGVTVKMLRTEVLTPLPAAQNLARKYDRYLALEAKRVGTLTWPRWVRWVFRRNLRTALGLSLRTLWIQLTPRPGTKMPIAYEWQFLRYALRSITSTFPLRYH